jgi:excisionase family DNA binding protein
MWGAVRRAIVRRKGCVPDPCQISLRRVFEMILDGRLPSVKIGRSRRVRSTDLAAYVAKLAVVPHHE